MASRILKERVETWHKIVAKKRCELNQALESLVSAEQSLALAIDAQERAAEKAAESASTFQPSEAPKAHG